ncbi:MAG: hypothetical protein Q9183_004641, partial [Haloplaca sp. 2 TL-2023]
WFPHNIHSLQEWDVYQAPPVELQARYDIVHARLLFVVVRDGDPAPMIKNMMRLLKPGGYLQWDELDVARSFVMKVEEGVRAAGMEETVGTLARVGHWVGKLAEEMERCGLVDARIESYEERRELAMPFFDINLAKDMEMANTRLKGTADGEALQRRVELLRVESKAGAVICTPKIVCVAQAPEQREL